MAHNYILIRFLWKGETIFEDRKDYTSRVDAEMAAQMFIMQVGWIFGDSYKLKWDWTYDDRIDIWVANNEKD